MSTYAATHARAKAQVQRAGAPVTFSHTGGGTYDPLLDRTAGAATTAVPGFAVRTKGDPLRYQALDLIPSEAPTLLFVPTVYGQLPALGASTTFGGVAYVVRDVDPVAPNGTAIGAKIIVTGGGPTA